MTHETQELWSRMPLRVQSTAACAILTQQGFPFKCISLGLPVNALIDTTTVDTEEHEADIDQVKFHKYMDNNTSKKLHVTGVCRVHHDMTLHIYIYIHIVSRSRVQSPAPVNATRKNLKVERGAKSREVCGGQRADSKREFTNSQTRLVRSLMVRRPDRPKRHTKKVRKEPHRQSAKTLPLPTFSFQSMYQEAQKGRGRG